MTEIKSDTIDAVTASPDTRRPDPFALELLRMAEVIINSYTPDYESPELVILRRSVTHHHDPEVTLQIEAVQAKAIYMGARLLAADLIVDDPRGKMGINIKRRHLRRYDLSDDPFAIMIADLFRSHLEEL